MATDPMLLLDDAANEIILADDDEPIRCAPRALRRPARRTPSRGLESSEHCEVSRTPPEHEVSRTPPCVPEAGTCLGSATLR